MPLSKALGFTKEIFMKRRFIKYVLLMALMYLLVGYANAITVKPSSPQSAYTHESIIAEMLAQLKAVTKILEGIKDEKSANSAVEPLTPLIEKLKPIKKHAKTIGPSLAEDKDLKAKYEAELKTTFKTFHKELMRIKRQKALYVPLKKSLAELELLFPIPSVPGRDFESGASFVLVDQHDPAFIVFTGIAKGTDERKLEEIRSKISNQQEVSMLTWEQFTASVDRHARSVIVRNDYPNSRAVDGLICLVGKQPGAPWGLAWNGGIALTFNDYQHVRRRYESYKTNPAAYRPIHDPRADPVNPGGFLPAFGCLF